LKNLSFFDFADTERDRTKKKITTEDHMKGKAVVTDKDYI